MAPTMKIRTETRPARLARQDLVALIHGRTDGGLEGLPSALRQEFRRFCDDIEAKRAKGPRVLLLAGKGGRCRVYFTSLSFPQGFPDGERLKILAAGVYQEARNQGDRRIALWLPRGKTASETADCLTEGLEIGAYRFTRYKSEKPSEAEPKIALFAAPGDQAAVQAAIARSQALAQSVNAARELINLPGSDLGPADLARYAAGVARRAGLSFEMLTQRRLKKEGYNGVLRVGGGSARPPCMIILRYRPRKASKSKHLALVGKGITFDTGGLNVKTAGDMWTMKSDMSGAAAAIHAIEAIARRRLALRVTAIVAAAENMIGSRATLPGDILVARNGKTIQVQNTDAEGRLTLTDALYRAGEEKATHIVDVATLTGACVRALGSSLTGLFANDSDLAGHLLAAGAASGEDLCQLPLYEEYRDMLKTPAADINNLSSSSNAGALTAALFLSEFVPKGAAWAHLDVAGTAFYEKKWKYFEPGGAGVMVRTLTRLAEAL